MAIQFDAYAAMKRLLLATTLGVVLVLTALPAFAGARPSGYPITMDVRATAKGDQAMPFNFTIQPGRVVVIRIRNYTRELHTFAIPAIGLNVAVLPGKPKAPRTTEVRRSPLRRLQVVLLDLPLRVAQAPPNGRQGVRVDLA
jgi:hypothetical protein